jgi:D-alanyl-D-alanine carboxypeptidase
MTHLVVYPSDGANPFFADAGYWKVAGELQTATGHLGMSRSIIRRSTRFGRSIRKMGEELGIPADYGVRHRLRLQAEAGKLVSIGKDIYGRQQKMTPAAARSWKRMIRKAKVVRVAVDPVSAFRSVDYQADLIRRKLEKGQSMDQILKVSAAPGYSEHHSGNAIDVTTHGYKVLEEPFEESPAFEWLCENAGEFGFHLSYPRNNRHGVAYEPWHWCWRRP